MSIQHFVTGTFESHATFLPEGVYATVLDNVVVTCVDSVVTNRGCILLGKRAVEPQPDWWVIGGRVKPGETFEAAATRCLKRELGLEISDPRRFRYLCTHSYVWGKRAQPPQEHGCHMCAVTLWVDLADAECAAVRPNEEYAEVRWFDPEYVVHSEHLHPAVIRTVEQLQCAMES